MRNIEYSSKFKRDFKLAKKQGKDLNKLRDITEKLVNDEQIPAVNLDHSLKGR
uniref:type II toxin-antitoxin system mRNA interferase toxin, RelE/StbE family n=1 Tax=Succinivibrio sp. TaxID=2053619 RepID=UPI00402A6BCB